MNIRKIFNFDYFVSDKETAYTDGAVHTDGYYYEKVIGAIKIDNGVLNEYYSKSGNIPKNNFISIDESASVSEVELYNEYEKGDTNFVK